mmetsp:Transcript_19758/g.63541  ORF Transcript_19758/g.63541 Transcript_19758/m.63541 type:complete len:293 (+) Transcript_19758:142-1020(+)
MQVMRTRRVEMWHPLKDTKKYKCSRCGEPKQGHVCKMVLRTESTGAQADPSQCFLTGEKTLTVTATKKKHRRQVSDPFPLAQGVDLPEFGLPDFQLAENGLDELFSSFSCDDFALDEEEEPPPPPPGSAKSPRTPFWEKSSPSPAAAGSSKAHRRSPGMSSPAAKDPGLPVARKQLDLAHSRPTSRSVEKKKSHRRIASEPFSFHQPATDPVALAAQLFTTHKRQEDPYLPRLSDISADGERLSNQGLLGEQRLSNSLSGGGIVPGGGYRADGDGVFVRNGGDLVAGLNGFE